MTDMIYSSNVRHAPIRVAVVGVGQMGGHHLRVYDELKNVELAGLYDPDTDLARKTADQYGCVAFQDLEAVAANVDAASVCSPSVTHREVGVSLLEQGVHCLIEKPLAATEVDCLALVEAAERSGAKLLVGHIERFNPAVQQLSRMLSTGARVYAIEARRLSAVSKRITDVDVVADLMVHDLDILLSLVNEPVTDVTARGVYTGKADSADYVTALITFEGGGMAQVTASRITQNQVRELQVTTDHGLISIDYVNQTLQVYQQGEWILRNQSQGKLGEYVLDQAIERAKIRNAEPLHVELKHFVDVLLGICEPLVTGVQALDAMRLVWRIQDITRQNSNHGK